MLGCRDSQIGQYMNMYVLFYISKSSSQDCIFLLWKQDRVLPTSYSKGGKKRSFFSKGGVNQSPHVKKERELNCGVKSGGDRKVKDI